MRRRPRKPPGELADRRPHYMRGPKPRLIWHFQLAANVTDEDIGKALGVSRNEWGLFKRFGREPNAAGWKQKVLALFKTGRRAAALKNFMAEWGLKKPEELFREESAPGEEAKAAADRRNGARSPKHNPPDDAFVLDMEVEAMLIETQKHFRLEANPFIEDVTEYGDVFLPQKFTRLYENLHKVARQGGFTAFVGESGCGKSVLRKYLESRLADEGVTQVIRPATLDQRKITTASILYSIIADLGGQASFTSEEIMVRRARELLIARLDAHKRNLLLIEDGQRLTSAMLYFLKGFYELEHCGKRLVGIIIFAQPELEGLLDENGNYALRQTSRRIEMLKMPSLNGETPDYLRFKFERAGARLEAVFDAGAVEQIQEALTLKEKIGMRTVNASKCYPLLVNILAVKAMNMAQKMGYKKVTADVVIAAQRPGRD